MLTRVGFGALVLLLFGWACGGDTRDTQSDAPSTDARSDAPSAGAVGGVAGTSQGGAGNISGWRGTGGFCFAAGTMIATPSGTVAIDRIRIDDVVLSYDERVHAVVPHRVTAVFVHPEQWVGTLPLEEGRVLRVTDNHPIYLPDEGRYVSAGVFRGGERLLALGEAHETRSTVSLGYEVGQRLRRETVYNITVEGAHNYFAEGVLVHNKTDGHTCVVDYQPSALVDCTPPSECIDPLAVTDEWVRQDTDPTACVDGGPDTASDAGGSPVDASCTDPVGPAGERAVDVGLCRAPVAGEQLHLAFEGMSRLSYGDYSIGAYGGDDSDCTGWQLGTVRTSEIDSPPPGEYTTHCIRVSGEQLRERVRIRATTEGAVRNIRFVKGCDCVRSVVVENTCQGPYIGTGESSVCEP